MFKVTRKRIVVLSMAIIMTVLIFNIIILQQQAGYSRINVNYTDRVEGEDELNEEGEIVDNSDITDHPLEEVETPKMLTPYFATEATVAPVSEVETRREEDWMGEEEPVEKDNKSLSEKLPCPIHDTDCLHVGFYINENRFTYIPPASVKPDLDAIIGILSAAQYFEKRQVVRRTWMTYPGNWKGYFIVSCDFVKEYEKLDQLYKERDQFGDLIILNSIEVYDDQGNSVLPLKTAAFLRVAALAKVPWVMKTDDDSYINVPYLLKTVIKVTPPNKFYGGQILRYQVPHREPGKWYVGYDVWPEDTYPDFAVGGGYLLSQDTVACMSDILSHCQFNPNEDVFVGALASQCEAPAISMDYVYNLDATGNWYTFNPPWGGDFIVYERILVKHYCLSEEEMRHHMAFQQAVTDRLG